MSAPRKEPNGSSVHADAEILDTALGLFAEVGIRRSSPDDIARRAGINRATLYRRLGSKQEIVRAALLQEVGEVRMVIAAEVDRIGDPVEQIAHGFALTVQALRTNRILSKTLAVDMSETLELLTTGAGEVLGLAVEFTEDWLLKAVPNLPEVEELAGLIVRLMHSLVVTPDAAPRLRTHEELHGFALRWVVPLADLANTRGGTQGAERV
ncbi:MAG: TetR/AcrR family transcriptional regulator [Nocardia sp.]|nr:TetR/AcrR family transcriptional regulator [Nocardia sp.]